MTTPAAPRPSASLILLRNGERRPECLLLERGHNRGAFKGFWVFPGGVVDAEDQQPLSFDADAVLGCEAGAGYYHAAIRELQEETGIVGLAADELHYFAYWTTPEAIPKRFATRFFVAVCPPGQGNELVYHDEEIVAGRWIIPMDALDDESLKLMPPTRDILWRLAGIRMAEEAVELARVRQETGIPHVLPVIEQEDGCECIEIPERR